MQRLLRIFRRWTAERLVAQDSLDDATTAALLPEVVDDSGYVRTDPLSAPLVEQAEEVICATDCWKERFWPSKPQNLGGADEYQMARHSE